MKQKKLQKNYKSKEPLLYQIKPVFKKETKNDLINYIKGDNWFTEFEFTKKFEEKFAKYTNSKYCICFPNGTLTMSSVLDCLKLKKGSEVLVSNYTMVATANVAKFTGLKLKLVDISDKDLCMCPEDLIKKISNKSKVVIFTHMNGRIGQIDKIKKICRKKNIILIEDAAHAIGSFFKKKHVGNLGLAGSFSFSMPKLITMGQGGAIVTNNRNLANKLRLYKNFGRKNSGEDIHNYFGYNLKITDMQSVLGLGQLKIINSLINKKKNIFKRYESKLNKNTKIKFFKIKNNETPWSVDVYIDNIKKVKNALEQKNIRTRYVYPPLNSQKIYKNIKNLPISEYFCTRGLWLPSSLDLKNKDIDRVCKVLNQIVN